MPDIRSNSPAFAEQAVDRLAAVRNAILIYGQDPDSGLDVAFKGLADLSASAKLAGKLEIAELASETDSQLRSLLNSDSISKSIGGPLDLVAALEQQILQFPLSSNDFLQDVSGFIESSFSAVTGEPSRPDARIEHEEFEIDDETLEIYHSEADELLENIRTNVAKLSSDYDDKNALWEIRRSSHTLKGAAGIVGLKEVARLAHRIEDLFDRMVENESSATSHIVEILQHSLIHLGSTNTIGGGDEGEPLSALYSRIEGAMDALLLSTRPDGNSTSPNKTVECQTPETAEPQTRRTASIVRVSLERLDEVIKLARSLNEISETLLGKFGNDLDRTDELRDSFGKQLALSHDIQNRLMQIRMVRFGTLETRLNRTVQMTSQEENKRVEVNLINADCEIDTQIIDVLIEPLLHLLKNAVVHGIESRETRRLIGKKEQGIIQIAVENDGNKVTLTVEDDGGGISAQKLKSRALQSGIISASDANNLDDDRVFDLIFHRGLTTADKVDLNAGRGVGMSIVRECVEQIGGEVTVSSEPQVGTSFAIRIPSKLGSIEHKQIESGSDQLKQLVLIVDDSGTIRQHNCSIVEGLGHRTLSAINGAEALEKLSLSTELPSLILSDIEMPVMDGWGLLENLKKDERLGSIPVVTVTSLAEGKHRERAYALGAVGHITKPLTAGAFKKMISEIGSIGSEARSG